LGPATKGERLAGKPVFKAYDLVFVKKGLRTARLYHVIFTNMIDPAKTFAVDISASSLKHLFKQIPQLIGNLRSTNVTTHFMLSCQCVASMEGMTEDTVHVPLGAPLTVNDTPPSNPVEQTPLQLED